MIADQLPFAEQFRDLQMEQLECSVLFILLRTKMKYFKMMTLQKALAACMIHSIIHIGLKAICTCKSKPTSIPQANSFTSFIESM